VSNKTKYAAISTLGKGVIITDYFHSSIKESHTILWFGLNNFTYANNKISKGIFTIKEDPCIIKMKLSRPESVRNAWLYSVKNDEKIKVNYDKDVNFKNQLELMDKFNDYVLTIEDEDNLLDQIIYCFRIVKNE
jgi:hypothetical protein